MNTLESLCAEYLGPPTPSPIQVIRITDGIAHAFYSDPRISRILEAALHREGLSASRKDDLRHDVFLAFTQSVLPKLQSPQSAIGSLKMTAVNCVKRMGSNRLDSELHESLSIDAAADSESKNQFLDRLLGVDNGGEDRMIGSLMKEKAKEAIEAAIANSDDSAKRTRAWVPMSNPLHHNPNRKGGRVPVREIPKASELAPDAQARYKDLNSPNKKPTSTQKRFLAGRDELGLTLETLADRLMIKSATLRSYLDLRVSLPDSVYEAMMALLKEPESKARIAYHKKTAETPIIEIVHDWMKRTKQDNAKALADVLGTNAVVVRRWMRTKPDGGESRPHTEALFNYEQRVIAYERALKKRA